MSQQAARWQADAPKLRAKAAEQGLYSLKAIAERVGVSPTRATMVIKDRLRVRSATAGRFASALGVEVDEVFEPATVEAAPASEGGR